MRKMPGEKRQTIGLQGKIISVVAVLIAFDQLTKYLIIQKLRLFESLPVIPGVLHFTRVQNRGAAFGMFKGSGAIFVAVALAAVACIIAGIKDQARQRWYPFALGLILAGTVGNLIDRLRLGYVIDFLDLRVWPVFNVADSAITIGAVILAWQLLKSDGKSNGKSKGKSKK